MKMFEAETKDNRGNGLQIVRLNNPEVDDVFNEARETGIHLIFINFLVRVV
jgi:hypothetical protein